jgi:hypothetical protein
MRFGSAWPGANFQLVDENIEITPDIHLIALVSDKPGTLELRELSLAINTPDGMAIVVGCSHPGIDKIMEAARTINPRIQLIVGGFHLVVTSDADIANIVTDLHDRFKVEYVAPGHCTAEPAFTALEKAFGDRYLCAGLGTTLPLTGSQKKMLIPVTTTEFASRRLFGTYHRATRLSPGGARYRTSGFAPISVFRQQHSSSNCKALRPNFPHPISGQFPLRRLSKDDR